MALVFLKINRNKQFNYKPVFWDKAKEERENRMKTALEQTDKDYATALRERMELRWKRSTGVRTRRNSNVRVVAVITGLALLFWYIFMR